MNFIPLFRRALMCLLASAGLFATGAQAPINTELGERLYLTQCAMCHGPKGEGASGPTLARPKLLHAADDNALKAVIRSGIAGTGMPGTRLIEAELQALSEYVRKLGQVPAPVLAGDVSRGQSLYEGKGNCTACHTLSGHGGAFGPDLTGIGASRSAQHLRASLLEPNADFPRDFAFIQAVTRAGKRLSGVRVNEDAFSIQLRDSSERVHSFFKADLTELHKDWGKSLMPSYRTTFTKEELDDVVAFLISLRGNQ